jgi:hypothetical protein
MTLHRATFIATTLAFYAYSLTRVQIGRWVVVGAGSAVLAALIGLARYLRDHKRSPYEPGMVLIAAAMGLALPVAHLPGPRGPGFLAAGIALLSAQLLWASARYEVAPSSSSGVQLNLRWGLRWGVWMAAGFSVLALVIVGIAWLSSGGRARGFSVLPFVLGAYWVGGLVGGVILGVLRPVTAWPLGAMIVGFVIAFCVYAACGAALYVGGDPDFADLTLRRGTMIGVVCGLLVGPPAALGTRDW